MENSIIEANYPLTFREEEARELGKHLKNHQSVVLIGMKRVGISNFLRFFLNHKKVVENYIEKDQKHLFIPVDLNDLVEREIYPFWILTLKRILDALEKSHLNGDIHNEIESLFLKSIQSQDLFLAIDNVRRALVKLVESNIFPTLFLLRFDRVKDAVTPEFFSNLQGLKDATHQRLSYVFTSYRGLENLSPKVFTKQSLSVFVKMYIKPAKKEDTKLIFSAYKRRYKLSLSEAEEKNLFEIVDGHVQYLQLALIYLTELKRHFKKEELFENLVKEERINLQSEELWESLENQEREVLIRAIRGEKILSEDVNKAKYLWDTGLVTKENKKKLFNILFEYYVKKKEKRKKEEGCISEFTKKENYLFNFLKSNINEICEREKIIETVWPEVEALGVTDWAIDRLVARVRNKLKSQRGSFKIQTIKTRGYKLTSA